jgi:hypothetical protein
VDEFGSFREALLGVSERGGGHIEHADIAEAAVEETVDEHRGSAPDVDDRLVWGHTERVEQRQRHGGLVLVPAHLGRKSPTVDLVPVPSHLACSGLHRPQSTTALPPEAAAFTLSRMEAGTTAHAVATTEELLRATLSSEPGVVPVFSHLESRRRRSWGGCPRADRSLRAPQWSCRSRQESRTPVPLSGRRGRRGRGRISAVDAAGEAWPRKPGDGAAAPAGLGDR